MLGGRRVIVWMRGMMDHIDEHILELYVLRSPDMEGRRGELEGHLLKCDVCRELAEEMATQYAAAARDLADLEKEPAVTTTSLVPSPGKLIPFNEIFEAEMAHQETPINRFVRFARRRPAVVATGGLGLVAACVLGGMAILKGKAVDNNPESVLMNEKSHRIEVFNKDYKLLWELPYQSAPFKIGDSVDYGMRPVAVTDMDGDGKSEVIVSARFADGVDSQVSILRVFNWDRSLKFQRTFPERLHYGPFPYEETYWTRYLLLPDPRPNKERDILVSIGGRRSPYGLVRINKSEKVIGEYWHYGSLNSAVLTEMPGVGERVGVLVGSNDAADTIVGNTVHDPTIVVVQPEKILGLTESSATRGFGMQPSQAELFYIKLPTSDICSAIRARSRAFFAYESDSLLVFTVLSDDQSKRNLPTFDFAFNRRMKLLWVKSVDGNNELHSELKTKGLIKSVLNQQYLDEMKRQIQYWDGTRWRNEWSQVLNPQ
jgi:hypothetical protein